MEANKIGILILRYHEQETYQVENKINDNKLNDNKLESQYTPLVKTDNENLTILIEKYNQQHS